MRRLARTRPDLLTRIEAGELSAHARRQADPADPEFVDPKGAADKGKGKRGSNTTALNNTERHSKPGTMRRLARLARIFDTFGTTPRGPFLKIFVR